MCCAFSDNDFSDSIKLPTFEEIQSMVTPEFDVKESFVEHGIPTFYIQYNQGTKQAFLRLVKRLDSLKLVPLLRKNQGRVILRVVAKPHVNPSKNIINVGLFFATLITLLISGYFLAGGDLIGAALFTIAIMLILGTHEMGHKLLADKHEVDATYPYFIPGIPFPFGIGTFGAVIRQKALPPNRDALFDIGFMGPITGFIIAAIVTIVGIQLSTYAPLDPNATYMSVPLLFQIIIMFFPPAGAGATIQMHPVAFAGWVGMVVTMLNLVPAGMFDGGHVARSIMNDKTHKVVSYFGIVLLALIGWWTMAILALFVSANRHPGPLDDVSEITTNRKIGAIILVLVFILSIVQM